MRHDELANLRHFKLNLTEDLAIPKLAAIVSTQNRVAAEQPQGPSEEELEQEKKAPALSPDEISTALKHISEMSHKIFQLAATLATKGNDALYPELEKASSNMRDIVDRLLARGVSVNSSDSNNNDESFF